MLRPRYVSDAIEVDAADVHVGRYGAIRLHTAYQPIYRLAPGGPVLEGCEGLIRPTRAGLPISPLALFAQVEPGDHLFVECMCRALHLRNFSHAGHPSLDLYINVNPAIYQSAEVIEREFTFMFSVLDRYGVSPHQLVCELVEEEELSTNALVRVCALFRSRGARIAMDDFGAGSSGSDRYAIIRPEVVKIDGSMFRWLATEHGGRRLLAALGTRLSDDGAELLVEGIETAGQLRTAIELGARLAQGYGLAPPQVVPQPLPAALAPPERAVHRALAG